MTDIAGLLGERADDLLTYACKGIPKESLVLPGPDFVDRVVAQTDRSPRVLVNLQSLFDHGRLGGSGNGAGDAEDLQLAGLALDLDRIHGVEMEGVGGGQVPGHGVGNDGLARLGVGAEARREVHMVADHGVVHALLRAHGAHDHLAHVDADADVELPFLVLGGELDHHVLDGEGAGGRVMRHVGAVEGRHDLVADILVDVAVVERH